VNRRGFGSRITRIPVLRDISHAEGGSPTAPPRGQVEPPSAASAWRPSDAYDERGFLASFADALGVGS
jgi:hypothetical protein